MWIETWVNPLSVKRPAIKQVGRGNSYLKAKMDREVKTPNPVNTFHKLTSLAKLVMSLFNASERR